MIKAASERGTKTLIVVRGRKLVDQASKRLERENVAHGVLMNGHWNHRPHLSCQVASIDTLLSRKLQPPADLIVIDESHLATSKGYREFLKNYPHAYIVAVTATPFVKEGLRHIADTVVHPITFSDLIEKGYLVPFRYFAPSTPDLTDVDVSKSTKDYVSDQLETAMNQNGLTGKIIDHWKKLASDRPTLCFAVNIHHSKILVERFLQAGIKAQHCDADTPDEEREIIIRRLENGELNVVSNVGIFCTGIDIPNLGAIIMARPTKSRNLFIQQAGRGTRIFPDKKDCLLLDHAGNISRHGLPTDEEDVDLNGRQRETTPKESKTCKQCFLVFRGGKCPECGFTPPPVVLTDIEESNDELIELKSTDPVLSAYRALQLEAKRKGYKPGWANHKLIDRFTLEVAKPYLPRWVSEPFKFSPFEPVVIK
jgi:DNA repair protein RadD